MSRPTHLIKPRRRRTKPHLAQGPRPHPIDLTPDEGPPSARLLAPALGPLMTVHHPGSPCGQSPERVVVGLGFDPSWGQPQALVLVAPGPGQSPAQVRHIITWPEAPDAPQATACWQAFALEHAWFEQDPELLCLLSYGDSTLPALQACLANSQGPLPQGLAHGPDADRIRLRWPQAWSHAHRPGTCFVVASCQYPAGLLDAAPSGPGWPPGPADQAFAQLQAWRQTTTAPQATQPAFALLLGDQVYIDATAGLFDPQGVADRYVQPYLMQLRHPARNAALRNLPLLCLPDDHEIFNDWAPAPHTAQGPARARSREDGLRQYWHFQRMRHDISQGPDMDHPVWQQFDRHGASFFMADSRTERSARTAASIQGARIMGITQHAALTHWIKTQGPQPHPKFLACPSAVLPRRRATHVHRPASALHSDAWDGYPTSLYQLLAALCEHRVQNTVLLSGDEHLSSVARITLQRLDAPSQDPGLSPHPVVRLASLHSSGWYSPYRFANSTPAQLRGADDFVFDIHTDQGQTRHYRCTVQTDFYPGDGFALVRTHANGQIDCRFVKGKQQIDELGGWQPLDWMTDSCQQSHTCR